MPLEGTCCLWRFVLALMWKALVFSILDKVRMTSLVCLARTVPGHVTDQVPGFDEVGLFALEFNHTLVGPLLKLFILIKPLLRLLIAMREETS